MLVHNHLSKALMQQRRRIFWSTLTSRYRVTDIRVKINAKMKPFSYQFSCFNQKQLDGFIWLSLCSVKTPTSSQPNQHLRCSRWRVNLLRYWSDWFKRTFSIYISFPTFSIYSGLISIGFSPFCASDDFWNCNFLKSTKFTH